MILVSTGSFGQTTFYETGTLEFTTTDQSMWSTGNGVVPQSEEFSSAWNDSTTIGGITGSAREYVPGTGGSVPNPAWGLWWICAEVLPAEVREFTCGSEPSSTISNPIPAQYIDTRTGSEIELSTSGKIGLTSSFGINGGTVDAAYKFSASLTFPDLVIPGEFFSLNPVSSRDSEKLTTFFPALTGRISATYKTRIDINTTACLLGAGCTSDNQRLVDIDLAPEFLEMNTPNLPQDTASLFGLDDLAFDATTITLFADFAPPPVGTGITLSLPLIPRPPASVNVGDITLDAPSTAPNNSSTLVGGKLVSSSNFKNVVDLNVDVDVHMLSMGVPVLTGLNLDPGPFTFRGDLVDIGIGPTVDIEQRIELDTSLMVTLAFDHPVLTLDYETPGIREVIAITAPFDNLPDIALIDGQPVTVTPTFFVTSTLDNDTRMAFDLTFSRDLLKGRVSLGPAVLADVCVSCEDLGLVEFGSVSLFNDDFALGGFDPIVGASFSLISNHPPEFTYIPADTNIEGNVTGGASGDHSDILAFLDAVTATDDEDDDATLLIEHTPIPDKLDLNSTTVITFTVTDSFGDFATAQATLTVVDTTPPVLSIGDLTVVSEGPTSTSIPDSSGLISGWMSSAGVEDIVDSAPTYAVAYNTPAELGANTVFFTATDAEGNSTTVEVLLYLNVPFSLYAEKSLRIDKDSTVLSGMVVGNGLGSDPAVIIKKSTYLTEASPLFAYSISLDKWSHVEEAHYELKSGKGTLGNSFPAEMGIYSPFSILPDINAGNLDIKVNCRHCSLVNGTVLQPGIYGDLDVSRSKKNPGVIYLVGGEYTFKNISLDHNAQIRMLNEAIILVEGKVKTKEGNYFGPHDPETQAANTVTLLVKGSGAWKDDNDDDKGKDKDKGKDRDREKDKYKDKADEDHDDDASETFVDFGEESIIIGNIIAPDGQIKLGEESRVTGSLFARDIRIAKESVIEFGGGL